MIFWSKDHAFRSSARYLHYIFLTFFGNFLLPEAAEGEVRGKNQNFRCISCVYLNYYYFWPRVQQGSKKKKGKLLSKKERKPVFKAGNILIADKCFKFVRVNNSKTIFFVLKTHTADIVFRIKCNFLDPYNKLTQCNMTKLTGKIMLAQLLHGASQPARRAQCKL